MERENGVKVSAEVFRTRWVELEERAEVTVEVPSHIARQGEEAQQDWILAQISEDEPKEGLNPTEFKWGLEDESETQIQYDQVCVLD